jgi:hypothetical protein
MAVSCGTFGSAHRFGCFPVIAAVPDTRQREAAPLKGTANPHAKRNAYYRLPELNVVPERSILCEAALRDAARAAPASNAGGARNRESGSARGTSRALKRSDAR